MNNYAIRMHPAVVHLFDGDFDGDQCHAVFPLSNLAILDIEKMDASKFIKNNPSQFKPKKEIAKYSKIWNTSSEESLDSQLLEIARLSTSGLSINFHDFFDEEGKTGYFDDTNVNVEELKKIAEGLTAEELIEKENVLSINNAVRSYKVIKQDVAKFGGLCNSLMALVINNVLDWEDKEQARQEIANIAAVKHILCQDGLSAKHGSNKLAGNVTEKILSAFYRGADNKLETVSDYREFLLSINLPVSSVETILRIFIRTPMMNINQILSKDCPSYIISRRHQKVSILENIRNKDNEVSLQRLFLEMSYERNT